MIRPRVQRTIRIHIVVSHVYVRRTRLSVFPRSRPPLLRFGLPSSTHIHVCIPLDIDIDIDITTRPCQTRWDNIHTTPPPTHRLPLTRPESALNTYERAQVEHAWSSRCTFIFAVRCAGFTILQDRIRTNIRGGLGLGPRVRRVRLPSLRIHPHAFPLRLCPIRIYL